MRKIIVDLGFANLVAELYENSGMGSSVPQEITITLEANDGSVIQDIAQVSQAINPQTGTVIPNSVRCLVWADPNSEDYTHEHVIEKFSGT